MMLSLTRLHLLSLTVFLAALFLLPSLARSKGRQNSTSRPALQRHAPFSVKPWKRSNKTIKWKKLLTRLTKHNPALKRLRQRIQVMRAREQQSGTWPDTGLGLKAANLPIPSFSPTPISMTGVQLSLSQKIPSLQTLRLQKKIAKWSTALARAMLQERLTWEWYRLRAHLSRWEMLRRSYHWQRQVLRWQGQIVQATRTLYTLQKSSRQTLLRAMTERSLSQHRLTGLYAAGEMARARLTATLGSTRLFLPGRLTWSLPSTLPSMSSLWSAAQRHRGALKKWRLLTLQSRDLRRVARASIWRGATLTLSYRQMFSPAHSDALAGIPHSAGMLSVGVKVLLPTGRNQRRRGLAREANARNLLAQLSKQETETRLRALLRVERTRWSQLQQQLRLSETRLIPLAKISVTTHLQHYPVGKSTYSQVFRALRVLAKEQRRKISLQHQKRLCWFRIQAMSGLVTATKGPQK